MPLILSATQIAFNARGDGKFNKPFQAQVDFFRQKLNLPSEHYDDIIKAAHDRAFIVAGAAKADLLNDLRDAVDKAINEGKSIGWFRQQFDDIVRKHGWEGWTGSDTQAGRDWRTRVIYQTNMRASYAAGRYAQMMDPDMLAVRPFWKYRHNNHTAHPREFHKKWGDKPVVLRYDHPWWQTHYTPNGINCGCWIEPVRPDEYKGDPAPNDGFYEKTDRFGVTHSIPNGVDYGWNYAPGANVGKTFSRLIDEKLIRFPPSIGADMWQALKPYLMTERTDAVKALVDTVATSLVASGNGVVTHVISPDTVLLLEDKGLHLEDAAIWLRDQELVHALRDQKSDRGGILPITVWQALPRYLEGADVYLDTQDIALLYAFELPDKPGKVVIRINRLEKVRDQGVRKKIVSNFIATGGVVQPENLNDPRYVLLK